ncbi:MAG: Gfo/Idh/MocA family oxidoreductase, partial [Alphaproteobacteria bacterium]|nr:Gfo/Idh/MocA family oxidoreductase [Alphaproteobacteria bacterium]
MDIKLAMIGAGFIGKSHALAMHAVDRVFGGRQRKARPFILAEADEARARASAAALDFPEWTTSWEQAVERADAVVIAVPSALHHAIASRAIAARKPVLCEKPVGLSSTEAAELADAATRAGVPNAVGFTYVRAPMVQHAKALVASGRLGKLVHFSGRHVEDYLADGAAPHSWRLSRATAGRCGALGDLGCHIISIARELCGPIAGLVGTARTVHAQRPVAAGSREMRAVENEDYASAILRFADGTPGLI